MGEYCNRYTAESGHGTQVDVMWVEGQRRSARGPVTGTVRIVVTGPDTQGDWIVTPEEARRIAQGIIAVVR